MVWIHGRYALNDNGSMTLSPYSDGYQQVQDPCGPDSNFIERYNDTEIYVQWRVFQDLVDGYKLHLFQFDGSPVAPLFQVSTQPIMLPTQPLNNDSNPALFAQSLAKTNGGATWTPGGIVSLASTLFTVAIGSFLF